METFCVQRSLDVNGSKVLADRDRGLIVVYDKIVDIVFVTSIIKEFREDFSYKGIGSVNPLIHSFFLILFYTINPKFFSCT